MSRWREYVADNPMTVEVKRFRNRYFSPGRMSSFNTLVLIMGAIGFCILTLLSLTIPFFAAEAVLYIELFFLTIVVPSMAHGSIAGEREKRTWDVLMTAPVSQAQVVVGKFLGAACGIVLIWTLFWIPTLLCYVNNAMSAEGTMFRANNVDFWTIVVGKVDILLYALTLSAFCILISARSRRAFGAFFTAFGMMFFVLALLPLFMDALVTGSTRDTYSTLMLSWHPVYALMNLFTIGRTQIDYSYGYSVYAEDSPLSDTFIRVVTVLSPIFFSIAFTVIFLAWATKTIRFLDFDTRFLPKAKDASGQ